MLMPTRRVSFWPCARPGEAAPSPTARAASPIQAALIREIRVMLLLPLPVLMSSSDRLLSAPGRARRPVGLRSPFPWADPSKHRHGSWLGGALLYRCGADFSAPQIG